MFSFSRESFIPIFGKLLKPRFEIFKKSSTSCFNVCQIIVSTPLSSSPTFTRAAGPSWACPSPSQERSRQCEREKAKKVEEESLFYFLQIRDLTRKTAAGLDNYTRCQTILYLRFL